MSAKPLGTRMKIQGQKADYTIGGVIDTGGGFGEIYAVNTVQKKTANRLLFKTTSTDTLPAENMVLKISKLRDKAIDTKAAIENLLNERRILDFIIKKNPGFERSTLLIDYGERNQQHFLALSKLGGVDLHDYLDALTNPLGYDDFILLATDMLLTIEALHAIGIIHRDIKPKNIRYDVSESGYERTKVLDFGISMRHGEVMEDMQNERFLMCKSSGFSPPESDNTRISAEPSFDIYSVGAIMYIAATNRNPPDSPTDEGLHPRVEVRNFDRKLNDWVAKCTHPSSQKRFQNARDAINNLHSITKPPSDEWVDSPQREIKSSSKPSRTFDISDLVTTLTPLDLVLVIDSTESMDPFRNKIQDNVIELSDILFQVFSNLKLTIVGLGDYESSDTLQFTSVNKQDELITAVENLSTVSGGGDDAEAYEFAFSVLSRTHKHKYHKWRKDANHMIIVIGDSFSHAFPSKMPFIRGAPGADGERTKQFNIVEAEFERFCQRHGMKKTDTLWNKFKRNNFTARDNWGGIPREGVIIDTTNKLLIDLHRNSDGNVMRPNIDKAIHSLKERDGISIHTIHCGDSAISEKFFQYLSVRGEGVALKLDSAEDIVAILSALILTNDKSNYDRFVNKLGDQVTSLLRPATTLMQSKCNNCGRAGHNIHNCPN